VDKPFTADITADIIVIIIAVNSRLVLEKRISRVMLNIIVVNNLLLLNKRIKLTIILQLVLMAMVILMRS
jgi:hypothetical protein